MEDKRRQFGFSLIETMLAVATLAIGMVFVAGTFTAGVYFASVSTEGTVATVVTDEAVAKITLLGLDPSNPKLKTNEFVQYEDVAEMDLREFTYPSRSGNAYPEYAWSAICRRASTDSRLVEFTIFVSRLGGTNTTYWMYTPPSGGALGPGGGSTVRLLQETTTQPFIPRPVRVRVTRAAGTPTNRLTIACVEISETGAGYSWFHQERVSVGSGFTLVDDGTGQIYRVLDSSVADGNGVTINPAWQAAGTAEATEAYVWVVPRPVAGGRCPLVAVYQRVIRF